MGNQGFTRIPGFGGFAPSLFQSNLGGQSGLGSSIGFPLGFAVGGPIGGLLGGLGGGLFGSLFGNKKPEQLHYFGQFDPVADAVLAASSNINGAQNQQLVQALNQSIMSAIDPVQALLAELDLQPAAGPLNLGIFRGAVGFGGPDIWLDPRINPNTEDAYELAHNVLTGGTSFGVPGGRTDRPSEDLISQAISGLSNDLWTRSIGGLTNADIFGRLGLPTAQDEFQAFLQQVNPQFSFGNEFDFSAPAQFTMADVLLAQQLGGLRNTQTQQTQLPVGVGPGGPSMSDTAFFKQAFGFNPWTEPDPTDLAAQLRALLGGLS